MAVGAFTKIGTTTIETTEEKYIALVRQSEQLRILKNFVRQENTIVKSEIINLINAMEANDE